MIRITGGEWKNRQLKTPKGMATRPSASRVREALFDVLGPDVRDSDFYDLFAGSGAVGFEALSRGARHCTFVEARNAALLVLRENVTLLNCRDRATCLPAHLPNWLKGPVFAPQSPVILFLDPPYATDDVDKTMEVLAQLDIPWQGAFCAVQTDRNRQMAETYGPWCLRKRYPHGDSALWMYETD
jgi:16S rRNA (guanine(966)-N(2))-methyltransferase RsmD